MNLLTVRNLTATIDGRVVLTELNLEIGRGEVQAIIGPNGSGKTSLAQALMGDSRYKILDSRMSKITFDKKNLLAMTVDERARAGLYVAWQNPMTIPGLNVFNLCKTEYEARGKKIESVVEFKREIEKLLTRVGLPKEYVGRGINEGFSGGEKKRLELLQLLLLRPKLAILDEIDSGLDEEGRGLVAAAVNQLREEGTSLIIISHYSDLLKKMEVDKVWEMRRGRLNAKK